MPTVTVDHKYQVLLPPAVRTRAGVRVGDHLEARYAKGKFILTPKTARIEEDEYTPAQRRSIDAGIAQGMEDFKTGRFHGPFDTADQAIAYIKKTLRQRAARKTRRAR